MTNWYKTAQKTPEMEKWFEDRTARHISLVQKYCKKIEETFPGRFRNIVERGRLHDRSKYGTNEKEPYIFLSWHYRCKDKGIGWKMPDGMQEKVDQATYHHITNERNSHHPESCSRTEIPVTNCSDRSAPKEIVDATEMKNEELAEMSADWMAMSDEKSTNPIDWADKNVNVKWKFTPEQKDLIYEILNAVWDK